MRYSGSPYEGSSYESNYNSITVQSAWTVAEFVSRCNSYFDYINVNYNSTTGISFSQYYPEITSAEIWDNELGAYKTVTYTRTNGVETFSNICSTNDIANFYRRNCIC